MLDVVLSPQAERDLRGLPAQVFRHAIAAIRALASEPRAHGTRNLQGGPRDDYRIRVDDYRVV